jgi:hypothetical protein
MIACPRVEMIMMMVRGGKAATAYGKNGEG